MRIVGVDVFAQYHDDVDGAAIEQRNQGCAGALDEIDFHVRVLLDEGQHDIA